MFSMDLPTTSAALSSSETIVSRDKTNEEILQQVATTFWIVFIFYVFASVAWVTYCIISYRRRLLKAYDSVDIENLRPEQGEGDIKPTESS
ncbi:unnamed protein product [Heligmosomoides polygyrus]|uniref:CcmD family protein n=1 Tax=Heligmosomoides polygyrus TaxID=6339 RepID=A0A183GH11_HELPZ|nr:unnamed protein product [Heligmosomoides polygyrus]